MTPRDGQGRHAVLEMPEEVDVVEDLTHRLGRVRVAALKMIRRDREPNVLCHCHVGEDRGVLVHHRDAELMCKRRRQLRDVATVEDDRAGVWGKSAGGDVHQRRLAGAVLAEERMHLAREHVE
jgi:hypothetical protein